MKAWAIASSRMLYYGTYPTKRMAIANHVFAFDKKLFEAGPALWDQPLNDRQKAVWKERQKCGDEAVKVTINRN
jgi:hypothetical protein